MKKNKQTDSDKKYHGSFSLTAYSFLWLGLFVLAVIFTQALRNSISGVFFILVVSLPFIEAVYVLIAYGAVRSVLTCSLTEAEKKQPIEYRLSIENASVLPYPFVEAEFVLPSETNMRCDLYHVRMSLSPRGEYNVGKTVVFPYRGSYTFGVGSIYIYDLLRFFRIRIKSDNYKNVFVSPRRLDIGEGKNDTSSDSAMVNTQPFAGYDRAELTEIKEYRLGDQMKNVHWKLSSKAQELMVKHYGANDGITTYVFPNMGSQFIQTGENTYDDDINEFCIDATVEITSSVVVKLLSSSNTVDLIFNDSREDNGICRQHFEALSDYEQFFRHFGSSPVMGTDCGFTELQRIADTTEGAYYIYVTSYLSSAFVKNICDRASGASANSYVYLYIPYCKTQNPLEMHDTYDEYITALTGAGVIVRLVTDAELS